MLTWGAIILKVLTLLEWLIEQGQKHKWITEGEDKEAARQLAIIWKKTGHANAIHERVRDLDDDKLDELLHSFEPKPDGQLLSDIQTSDNAEGGRIDKSIQGSAGKTRIE